MIKMQILKFVLLCKFIVAHTRLHIWVVNLPPLVFID